MVRLPMAKPPNSSARMCAAQVRPCVLVTAPESRCRSRVVTAVCARTGASMVSHCRTRLNTAKVTRLVNMQVSMTLL
uniref:Secreted protein n=1 Tax=Mesocestoides corti TaxID=53468 RepID=A0A5K3FND2_MESCO